MDVLLESKMCLGVVKLVMELQYRSLKVVKFMMDLHHRNLKRMRLVLGPHYEDSHTYVSR